MGRSRWITVALVTLGVVLIPKLSLMALGGADNPYKTASVGQWVEYATTTETMGTKMQMTTKQTIVAKDATSVTLRTEMTAMGQKMPPQDVKIPFDKPYEPYKAGANGSDAKATLIGEGNETITVGGKPYACHWTKMKVVATKPAVSTGNVKTWTCSEVPAGGMVKMEMDTEMTMGGKPMATKMVMELKGFGK